MINKVTEKLNKRVKKSHPHRVDPYDSDRGRGDYEIIHHSKTIPNGDLKNLNILSTLKKT
jgi:hypothetical protein